MKDFPQLENAAQDHAVQQLLHWSLANGLVLYPQNFKTFSTDAAPVTLFPTPFPRSSFNLALQVQPIFNRLYAKIAANDKWLTSIIDQLTEFDQDFTGRLWQTYLQAKSIGITQPLALGLVRSDYMLDQITNQIKQIEYNVISVSFAGLGPKVANLHRYLNQSGAYDAQSGSKQYYNQHDIATSEATANLVEGLAKANDLYHREQKSGSENPTKSTIVLFVVQENERNVFDQRHLEYILLQNHGLKSRRATLAQVLSVTRTDPNTKQIYYIPTNDEISIIYYRTGYAPTDYKSDKDWETRLNLETTKAIKSPTLLSQISGSKKVQQLLTDKSLIERILNDNIDNNPTNTNEKVSTEEIDLLLQTFVNIYPLDDSPQGRKAKQLAFANPERYVLKPQREGGGNNIYKNDIPAFLKSIPELQWNAYILMDLINPPSHPNKIVRAGEVYHEQVLSELGIFGTIVWDTELGTVHSNTTADYLLRSKFSSSNEGGVAAGFGCVDSLYLY